MTSSAGLVDAREHVHASELARAEAQRNFLARVLRGPTRLRTGACIALALYGAGVGEIPGPSAYPHDPDEWASCVDVWHLAAPHMRAAMRPVIDRYRVVVLTRWGVAKPLLDDGSP
jgi:hypothetical protein